MKTYFVKLLNDEKFCVLMIALVAIAVMLPVLIIGLPYGYDLPHHYQCATTFYESILSGDFYPSWSLNRNFGYGGMETRLYPPISHYSLAIFYLITGNWHIATWLVLTLFSFLGGYAVYLWAREYLPASQAVFAGCIYILLPYHLNQVYNTFFYAEFVGSSLLPFTFVFISRVCRRGKMSDVVGLAISFAVLILTHLPLTVIGSICFAVYGLSLLRREKILSQSVKLATGVFGGLAASSFFWTKVLQERDLLAKTIVYPDPWLDYRLHFLLTPLQTYVGDLQIRIYETSAFFYDLMFLYTVILALGCTVPFWIWLKRTDKLTGIWLVFGLSVFLATPFSRFVWDLSPLLQEVQFPWRWLSIVSITASVLSASKLNYLVEWFTSKKRPYALLVTGSIFFVIAFSFGQIMRQAPFLPKEGIAAMMEQNAKAKGFTFWWTIWTKEEVFNIKDKVLAAGRDVQIENWTATEKNFQISTGETENARIAVFYHPNWKATVNDIPVETKPDENGAVLIPISNQASNVKLYFQETLAVIWSQWLSAIVWLSFLGWAIFLPKKFLSSQEKENNQKHTINKKIYEFAHKLFALSQTKYGWLLLVVFAFLSLLPMMFFGVYNGGDLYQHAQFATTFQNAIMSGDFYPSWAGNENLGYGSLGVRFYPPLSSFLWASARIVTGNWHTATWVTFLFFTIVGSLGVYFWAKEFFFPSKSVLAGLIFILMPYHLWEIYNASMYAEFAGFSVITFSFLFVTRICRKGSYLDVLGLGISYGILILTHLPSTVIGSLALFLYSLTLISKNKFWSTLLKLSVSVFLGLLASSIYWTRMAFEQNWMRNTKFWKDSHFDYHFNFLLTSPWFDNPQLWFFNLILLSVLILISFSIISLYLSKNNETKNGLRGVCTIFFFSVFMTTAISQPVWSITPFLHEVQFPWRWLTISSISGAILAAAGVESIWKLYFRSKNWKILIKAFIGIVFICFSVIFALIAIEFQLTHIPSENFDDWIVEKSQSMGAEWFWTTKTKNEAFLINDKVIAKDREVNIANWRPSERNFEVKIGKETNVRVATLFYPHWRATVDNKLVDPILADDGAILIPIPAENSTVKIWFQEPYYIVLAKYISILTWLLLGLSGLFYVLSGKRIINFARSKQNLELLAE